MNILMSADKDVLTGVEVVIYSTMQHNKNVHWYIFTMDIITIHVDKPKDFHKLDKMDERWLRKIVKYFDQNSTLEIIDVGECYNNTIAGNVNEYSGFTPFTNLRLLADLVLPEEIEHTWYLDCDIIVQRNLELAYNEYCKVDCNYCAFYCPEAHEYEGEMVAGILIFNMNNIRKSGFLEKARNNLMKNHYLFPDQMAMRDSDDAYPMEETFNWMRPLYMTKTTPHIIHTTHKIPVKIYRDGKTIFYNYFPQFKYIDEGLHLISTIQKD